MQREHMLRMHCAKYEVNCQTLSEKKTSAEHSTKIPFLTANYVVVR